MEGYKLPPTESYFRCNIGSTQLNTLRPTGRVFAGSGRWRGNLPYCLWNAYDVFCVVITCVIIYVSYAILEQETPPYAAAPGLARRLQLYPSKEALSAGGVLDLEVWWCDRFMTVVSYGTVQHSTREMRILSAICIYELLRRIWVIFTRHIVFQTSVDNTHGASG